MSEATRLPLLRIRPPTRKMPLRGCWRRHTTVRSLALMLLLASPLMLPGTADADAAESGRRHQGKRADAQAHDFAGQSAGQPARNDSQAAGNATPATHGALASQETPEASRPLRFSSEERRRLRRDLHEAGRDLYAPR